MKQIPLYLLTIIVSFSPSRSQGENTAAAPGKPSAARIIGDIPDGRMPPPGVPKPVFQIAPSDMLHSTTHEQGGRTITLQEIKPIALPPPQPAQVSTAVSEEFRQRLAEYSAAETRSSMIFISATVYRSKELPPRTLIQIRPQDGGNAIELWSSADMALIAGGINRFSDSAGNTHQLFIRWSSVDIDRLSDFFASKDRKYTPPEMPAFPEGKATFQIIGSQPAGEDLNSIQSLHDLYNTHHDQLIIAYQGRMQARLAAEAKLKAHPPQPQDITLNYWRIGGGTPVKGPTK